MSQKRTIFLILHSRYPAEKAASLFAAKSCEAFADLGENVQLIVPRRLGRLKKDSYEYYGVAHTFNSTYVPVIDLFRVPIIKMVAFYISFITFSISTFVYILFKSKKGDVLYSNESLPLLVLAPPKRTSVYEMHDFPEKKLWFYRTLFKTVSHVLVTNSWKINRARELFPESSSKFFLEQNAVDLKEFPILQKDVARAKLTLPAEGHMVVYTGHLYKWKGVHVLAEAVKLLPSDTLVYFIGGTNEDVPSFTIQYGHLPNIRIVGHRPHSEIPYWQAAADVLVLPNTGQETIAALYTSPMKLFEYMASGVPIVASDLPSIRELLNEDNALLVPPDNPQALADAILKTMQDADKAQSRAMRARKDVETHTWHARAVRILPRITGAELVI